jgi:hypothetical protein
MQESASDAVMQRVVIKQKANKFAALFLLKGARRVGVGE